MKTTRRGTKVLIIAALASAGIAAASGDANAQELTPCTNATDDPPPGTVHVIDTAGTCLVLDCDMRPAGFPLGTWRYVYNLYHVIVAYSPEGAVFDNFDNRIFMTWQSPEVEVTWYTKPSFKGVHWNDPPGAWWTEWSEPFDLSSIMCRRVYE